MEANPWLHYCKPAPSVLHILFGDALPSVRCCGSACLLLGLPAACLCVHVCLQYRQSLPLLHMSQSYVQERWAVSDAEYLPSKQPASSTVTVNAHAGPPPGSEACSANTSPSSPEAGKIVQRRQDCRMSGCVERL